MAKMIKVCNDNIHITIFFIIFYVKNKKIKKINSPTIKTNV